MIAAHKAGPIMPRRPAPVLVLMLALVAAGAANAQFGGGQRRGGGPGGGPHGPAAAPAPRPKPVSDSDIVGVVKAIDPAGNRMTIAYDPVEARDWPAGTMPFVVARPSLFTGVTVGEKVRFKVESQQIVAISRY
jgi:Cu/Ag efflux protein CusF